MSKRIQAIVIFGAICGTLSPQVASASPEREEHCVVRVIGKKPSGEFVTTAPQCHSTFEQAMAAAGAGRSANLADGATSDELAAYNASAASSIIGVHYDGASFTGSSLTVNGSDCSGGWANMSSTWNNRISSTSNGCYRIRHWDGTNKTGASEDTIGAGGNLSALNNQASSIQYLS